MRVKHEMCRYSRYLENCPDSMTAAEADEIWGAMLESYDETDEDLAEFYEVLVTRAAAYASVRAGWLMLTREQKIAQDPERTRCHDSFINAVDMLAAFLKKEGRDISWYERLGTGRKRVGDFACFLSLIYALSAR